MPRGKYIRIGKPQPQPELVLNEDEAKLAQLVAQREELDAQIAKIREKAMLRAIAECRIKIGAYGITSADLFGKKGK